MDQRTSLQLRFEIQDLFDDYAASLDAGDLDRWVDFFAEEADYQIIPRENRDRGLPLATVRCESRGMLRDRAYAVRETMMYEPRYLRHLVSGVRVREASRSAPRAEASYCVFETLVDEETKILQTGRYEAAIVRDGESLRFRRLHCVFDSIIVPNSLVYPI